VEHLLALYDGEIRWVDEHVARLLAVVEELGVADQTAIIVTADHGDEFFEHGIKGHERTLYREVVQVPLIMRVRGITRGIVVQTPISLADVPPTILDRMGTSSPNPKKILTTKVAKGTNPCLLDHPREELGEPHRCGVRAPRSDQQNSFLLRVLGALRGAVLFSDQG
jgi:arylsulfatase A-like enzyme